MAHANSTLKTYASLLKTASSVLVLTANLLMVFLMPNLFVFGVCMVLFSISLVGVYSLRRTLFVVPLLATAITLIGAIVTSPVKGLFAQIAQSFEFLLIICTIEIGSSTMYFNRILQRTKDEIRGGSLPLAMANALGRYLTRVTIIIAASWAVSSLSLLLGNAMEFKIEPLFLVAAATAILLISLVFLGMNSRASSAKAKKSRPKSLLNSS